MSIEIIPVERIRQTIFIVRAQKIMLDHDLAILYGIETRVLNQAVKRNRDRFPPDFMFELSRKEIRNLSQFVISSPAMKHAPKVYAFTEQGIAMLSGVLNSPRAIRVNPAVGGTGQIPSRLRRLWFKFIVILLYLRRSRSLFPLCARSSNCEGCWLRMKTSLENLPIWKRNMIPNSGLFLMPSGKLSNLLNHRDVGSDSRSKSRKSSI